MMEKLLNSRSLSKAIEEIVKESIKSSLYHNGVDEKEHQARASRALDEEDDDLFGDDEDKKQDKGAEDTPGAEKKTASKTSSKTMDDEKEKLKKGDVTPEDIVSKLNSIRAGKSFKDESIASKLQEYIDSLSKPERVALLAFLKGISQIVSGEVEPEAAIDPSDKPADVEMKKGPDVQKKTLKPNVIKAPSAKSKSAEKPSAEDTSGPVPIVPRKK